MISWGKIASGAEELFAAGIIGFRLVMGLPQAGW